MMSRLLIAFVAVIGLFPTPSHAVSKLPKYSIDQKYWPCVDIWNSSISNSYDLRFALYRNCARRIDPTWRTGEAAPQTPAVIQKLADAGLTNPDKELLNLEDMSEDPSALSDYLNMKYGISADKMSESIHYLKDLSRVRDPGVTTNLNAITPQVAKSVPAIR